MYTFAKRGTDILLSVAGLILLSPIIIYVAIRVRISSPGPVLYSQERVGYGGQKFMIRKFRSMYEDAEINGPGLSEKNDSRITSWGRAMRNWKLDELPQLWNVIVGEMSLVGPRPEREHYISQIEGQLIDYKQLLAVKPGITSLGMIEFGYAENVMQMIERMQHDIVYLQQRSFSLDMKILLRTIKMIFMAKGR